MYLSELILQFNFWCFIKLGKKLETNQNNLPEIIRNKFELCIFRFNLILSFRYKY